MQEIKAQWKLGCGGSYITIDSCSFYITPLDVACGKAGIIDRMLSMQRRSLVGKDITKEDMEVGAEMLLKINGIRKWAQLHK